MSPEKLIARIRAAQTDHAHDVMRMGDASPFQCGRANGIYAGLELALQLIGEVLEIDAVKERNS